MSNVVPIKAEQEFPIEAIDDIVIIEQLEEEMTAGGILLTGDERKFPSGRVVAVGPGRVYTTYMDASGNTLAGKVVPCSVKVGDWVLFGKYNSGGEPIELDGKRYLMCRQGDIAGRSRNGDALRVRLSP